jgi:hypothetical protein
LHTSHGIYQHLPAQLFAEEPQLLQIFVDGLQTAIETLQYFWKVIGLTVKFILIILL